MNAVSVSRIEMIPKCIGGVLDHVRHLVTLLLVGLAAPDHTVPTGLLCRGGAVPGTSCLATISLSLRDKSHSPIEGHPIKLALMGFSLGYAFMAFQVENLYH